MPLVFSARSDNGKWFLNHQERDLCIQPQKMIDVIGNILMTPSHCELGQKELHDDHRKITVRDL